MRFSNALSYTVDEVAPILPYAEGAPPVSFVDEKTDLRQKPGGLAMADTEGQRGAIDASVQASGMRKRGVEDAKSRHFELDSPKSFRILSGFE